MADGPGTEINGWIGRARALASVLNTLVIAPAVLLYVALVASGYIPFRPLDAIARDLKEHRAETQRALIGFEAMTRTMMRFERRDRLVECHARYPESKTREWCLSLGEEEAAR